MNDQIATLKENLDVLPGDTKQFAQSLVRQFEKKGSLSEKQWPWVAKLIEQAECVGVPDFTKETVVLGEFSGVIALFDKAKQHLKYPRIMLALPDGSPVGLSVAGPNSKYAGMVCVTDGQPYGSNKWYGPIAKNGSWDPAPKAEPIKDALTKLLAKLAQNPARVAAEHGKLTGRCCFCHSTLTEEKSTDVGYGPVCAKRFGLKWGSAATK